MTGTKVANSVNREPLSLQLYRHAMWIGKPVIDHILERRLAHAKEDGTRISERKGKPSRDRPAGTLIWCHAASVGESLALLRLIEQLLTTYQSANVLLTTGTLTSARLISERLPPRAFHQFVPVDHPVYIKEFLNHWQPDLTLWMESELWPNLLSQTRNQNVPIVLVNARMSDTSFRFWRHAPRTIRALLECFDKCLAQDERSAERFHTLGAMDVVTTGNLKFASEPLAATPKELEKLKNSMGKRPAWLAASTHQGEEEIIAAAHAQAKTRAPDLLATIVPRHPERGPCIADILTRSGCEVALRSRAEPVGQATEIYIADTLGELGLFYRLNPISFIGGSLVPHGGQNPLEAAHLDSAILHGPHIQNFATIYRDMHQRNAALKVESEDELASAIIMLTQNREKKETQLQNARQIMADGDNVLNRVVEELGPLFEKIDLNSFES